MAQRRVQLSSCLFGCIITPPPHLIRPYTASATGTTPFAELKQPPVQSTEYSKEQGGTDVLEILDHTLWP
jgi:hypothetical protein